MADCAVDGRSCRVIVESSAKLSYIDHKTAVHFTPVGKENDFYPAVGSFETPVYEVPVRLGRLNLTLRCGVLPQTLESALFVRGKRGIIGSELFKKYVVTLAFPEKKMLLQPGA